jgi:hypothetical protein
MNDGSSRAGAFCKRTQISNGITFTITNYRNYHGDTPLVVVSFVKRSMELTQLICYY